MFTYPFSLILIRATPRSTLFPTRRSSDLLERHIELHRLLLGWLVLLRLIDEHERRVDLDGVIRLTSIQGRVHGRRDHRGVPYQGHGVQPERPLAVLGALGLDQVVEHG